MSTEPSPPRGRGRPPQIDQDQVVDAAIALTRRVGLGGFSLKGLAAAVGVSTMSLYHHVESRDALDRLVVARLASTFPLPPRPRRGRERAWLRRFAATLRERGLEYPGTAEHLLVHGPTGAGIDVMESVVRVLLAAGVPERGAARAYGLLISTTLTAVIQQVAVERTLAAGANPLASFQERLADASPMLRRVAAGFTGDFDEAFDYAIDRVLDAIIGRPVR